MELRFRGGHRLLIAVALVVAAGCSGGDPTAAPPISGVQDATPAEPEPVVTQPCQTDAPVDELITCEAVAVGSGFISRVGAGLDERPSIQADAVIVDLGGPGAPWSPDLMLDTFGPLKQRNIDVWVYREPWTVVPLTQGCRQQADAIAAAVGKGGWVSPAMSLEACGEAQLGAADYGDALGAAASTLDEMYNSVRVVGFSYGATRVRAALDRLPEEVPVLLIEPGPHPDEAVDHWGSVRVNAAVSWATQRCQEGGVFECELLRRRQEGGSSAESRLAELALVYRSSYPESEPVPAEMMAARALSINDEMRMLEPGVGFIVGICRQSHGSDTGGLYSSLASLCPDDGGPPATPGGDGRDVCLVLNTDSELVRASELWATDPAVKAVVTVPAGSRHGAAFFEYLRGTDRECAL